MKYVILFTVSFLSFFNVSAMERQEDKRITVIDLKTIDNKDVTFFADYMDSTSLARVNINVPLDRKSIQLSILSLGDNLEVTSRDINVPLAKPLDWDNKYAVNYIKYNQTIYNINSMVFQDDSLIKKNDHAFIFFSPLFKRVLCLVCFLALLKYLNHGSLHKIN